MQEPVDPFEITQRDSPVSSSLSQDSPSSPSPRGTGGALVQLAALGIIGAGWLMGKVPVAWHALLAIAVAALPPDVVLQLGKWIIRLAVRMRGGSR